MSAINFPNNPFPGQQEVFNGVTYTWDAIGGKWVVTEGPFYSGATGATGQVGYGLYAFARVNTVGTILGGATNLTCTLTRPSGDFVYEYRFIPGTEFPPGVDDYNVVTSIYNQNNANPNDYQIIVENITNLGFDVKTYRSNYVKHINVYVY